MPLMIATNQKVIREMNAKPGSQEWVSSGRDLIWSETDA
jgi:hypothetical protein